MNKTVIRTGAGILVGGALILTGVSAANAATFTGGHTDIVNVSCDANGVLTVDTVREDVGHISRAAIGDQNFTYTAATSNGGLTYNSGTWNASGDGKYEESIPFIGFQYSSAGSSVLCPSSVSFDVSKVAGAPNAGDATFTSNNPANGTTSSADGSTSKVTVFRPGSGLGDNHQHGSWAFTGAASGGDYTLKFDTFRNAGTTPIATTSPVHIRVQP